MIKNDFDLEVEWLSICDTDRQKYRWLLIKTCSFLLQEYLSAYFSGQAFEFPERIILENDREVKLIDTVKTTVDTWGQYFLNVYSLIIKMNQEKSIYSSAKVAEELISIIDWFLFYSFFSVFNDVFYVKTSQLKFYKEIKTWQTFNERISNNTPLAKKDLRCLLKAISKQKNKKSMLFNNLKLSAVKISQ